MEAWTDYPFLALGDPPRQKAPIRKVTVVSYDGDKYCKVRVDGITESVKAGYLYKTAGRIGTAIPIDRGTLLKTVSLI